MTVPNPRVQSQYAAAALVTIALTASSSTQAQSPKAVPLRTVSSPVEAPETFLATPNVRALPGGRLLVNDQRGKRLMVFDSTLQRFTLSADSASVSGVAYPNSILNNPLVRFVADSSLLVDFDARVYVVVDPNGKLTRPMAPVKSGDLSAASRPWSMLPASDGQGRVILRGTETRPFPKAGDPPITDTRDTISIVRADFNTRQTDTIAFFSVPRVPDTIVSDSSGKAIGRRVVNAGLSGADEPVALSDGSLAIVREHDYVVDFIMPDGKKSSSGKIPFDWIRQTDEMKQARIDSMKRIIDSTNATGVKYGTMYRSFRAPDGGPMRRDTVVPRISFAPLSEMADYPTPFRRGQTRADEHGNLWVLPTVTKLSRGGLVYDVINQKEGLHERVEIPAGWLIAGFGKGDEVYLMRNDIAAKVWRMARVRIVRGKA